MVGRVGFAAIGLAAALLAGTSVGTSARAQATYAPASKLFRLDGGNVTYAFAVTPSGTLQSVYWGPRLAPPDNDLMAHEAQELSSVDPSSSIAAQEYPGWGGGLYTEPALKVAYPDGVRDVVLHYVSGRADGNGVTIELSDIARPLWVTLHYTIDPATGIIGRSATIRNAGQTICEFSIRRHRPRGRCRSGTITASII